MWTRFHVKHGGDVSPRIRDLSLSAQSAKFRSFADTKITEDHVENILHVDTSEQLP
jgi:hypothetical protein